MAARFGRTRVAQEIRTRSGELRREHPERLGERIGVGEALGFATLARVAAELAGGELKWTGLRRAVFALPLFWLAALALTGFERRSGLQARDLAHLGVLAAGYGTSYWAILRQRGESLFPGDAGQNVNVAYLHAAIAAVTLELLRFVTPHLDRTEAITLVLSAPTIIALAAFSGVRSLRLLVSTQSAPRPSALAIPALVAAWVFVAAGAGLRGLAAGAAARG